MHFDKFLDKNYFYFEDIYNCLMTLLQSVDLLECDMPKLMDFCLLLYDLNVLENFSKNVVFSKTL